MTLPLSLRYYVSVVLNLLHPIIEPRLPSSILRLYSGTKFLFFVLTLASFISKHLRILPYQEFKNFFSDRKSKVPTFDSLPSCFLFLQSRLRNTKPPHVDLSVPTAPRSADYRIQHAVLCDLDWTIRPFTVCALESQKWCLRFFLLWLREQIVDSYCWRGRCGRWWRGGWHLRKRDNLR